MNAKLQIPQKHMYFYELKKYDVETRFIKNVHSLGTANARESVY